MLSLRSPTYPLTPEYYAACASMYVRRRIYDFEFLDAGPLFIHHLSRLWIDFWAIQDDYVRERGTMW